MISSVHRPSRPRRARLVRLVVPTLAIALAGSGCQQTKDLVKGRSRFEVSHEAHSQGRSKVQLLEVRLAPGPDGGDPASVFQLTLRNTRDERLWARLVTRSPQPGQGCENLYQLEPLGAAQVQCPQKLGTTGTFALELTVYDNLGHSHVVERAHVNASFGPDGVAQVEWE